MAAIGFIGREIPNNESLTGEIDLGKFSLVAIELPTNWAGTQITFQAKVVSREDADPNAEEKTEQWRNVYDSAGNELVVTVGANRIVTDIPELAPLRYIRIRSGTSTTTVNQSPSKQVRLIVKE